MGATHEAFLWLKLLSVEGISIGTWLKLRKRFTIVELAAMVCSDEGRERLSRLTGKNVCKPDRASYEKQIGIIEKGLCLITSIEDQDYPPVLKEIAVPPPVLYYIGDIGVLAGPSVCIVGSRCGTRSGLIIAGKLASELSLCGVHVVSGLARGIDTAAHIGALEGQGGTSAVLGTGIDVIYPRENKDLSRRIVDGGGVILTEFSPGTPPNRFNFPRRNRILSGLALGTVVVQADLKSGAMGTAMWALEQNREVFAVPGSVDSPLSKGPNNLIKKGAHLVESAADILEILRIDSVCTSRQSPTHPRKGRNGAGGVESPAVRAVVSSLGMEPKHIDEIVEICNISPEEILPILLELEMRGFVVSCGGNRFALQVEG